ncbi:MAG TPA: metalloregulator ArsR/SmtB family transcription factor [Streptosporangiaceae bacterium]|nr:metalloregulator ArsR/SmtB family transcription factor [Streptosporangiaceae bacterium]
MVEDQVLDRTYAALADPTRRALLVALRAGDARITDLAAPLPMTFAGVSRHVGVLESAGLVQRAVRGREHWLSIRPEGLSAAEGWLAEQTAFWSRRADALAARLARDRPAIDQAAGDRTAGDRTAIDRAPGDRTAGHQAAGHQAAGDRPAADRSATDRQAGDRLTRDHVTREESDGA